MFDADYDLFILIVEAGTISAAARASAMSTAAMSKRLARLEERLSTRLINRTTRSLALTSAGKVLQEALLPMRKSLQAAEERISGRHDLLRGPLRATAPTSSRSRTVTRRAGRIRRSARRHSRSGHSHQRGSARVSLANGSVQAIGCSVLRRNTSLPLVCPQPCRT